MKTISRLAILAPLLAALLCVLPRGAGAATYRPAAATSPAGSVPNAINYQGRLVDNGFPVNATRTITFRLYDASSGGTLLYTVPSQSIIVSQGVFGCTLVISTAALAGPAQKYLEVQIDSTVLSPREPLNAVPYALIAKSLEDNVSVSSVSIGSSLISSGTLAVASLQALTGATGVSVLSPVFFTAGNDLGLGTLNPATLLHLSSGTLTIDGTAATAISAVGNVGLGLTGTAPNAQLQVANPGASPASPDLIVGNGASGSGNNTQAAFYRGGALGSYVGLDAYDAGVGGAPLILNGNNNGKVGIGAGAIAPGAMLDVDGSAQFGSAGTKSAFAAGGTLTIANNAGVTLTGSAGNINTQSSVTASGFFGGAASIGAVNAAAKIHLSSGTLLIDGNAANSIIVNGRVGVGTNNPATKFHMSSGTLLLDGAGAALTVNGTITATSFSGGVSGNATSATNLANGAANQVPYQSGANATTFVAAPGANVVLSGNSGAPFWTNTPTFAATNLTGTFTGPVSGNATSATNVANGAANQIPYQSGASATTFVAAPGANVVLAGNSGAPAWTNTPTFTGTNISGTAASLNIGGNAATATALAANGANCSAGSFPLGVDASGAAESCSSSITGNAATATNVAGGAANQLHYQSGASATTFVAAPGANVVLFGNSGAPSWTNTPTITGTNFSGIPNGALTNSAVTVSAGSGLSGGGSVSLGASTSLSLNVGNSNTWTAAQLHSAAIGLFAQTKAQLSAVVPTAVGQVYFCSNCTGAVGATGKIVVSTGTSAGNFADAAGGLFQ